MGFGCLKKPELRGHFNKDTLKFVSAALLGSLVPAILFRLFYVYPRKKRFDAFMKENGEKEMENHSKDLLRKGYITGTGEGRFPF